jgi:hypothetical protein
MDVTAAKLKKSYIPRSLVEEGDENKNGNTAFRRRSPSAR